MVILLRSWVIAVAVSLPFSRWLPEPYATVWLLASGLLIIVPTYVLWAAVPRYPYVWVLAAGGMLIGALTAAPYADNPGSHWFMAAQLVLWTGLGPFALAGLRRRIPHLGRRALTVFVLAETVSGLAALIQALGGSVLGIMAVYGRSPGLAGHPNLLGMFSGLALILLVDEMHRRRSLALVVMAAINAGGMLASGSLSATIAFGGGLAVFLIARRVRLRTVVGLLMAAALALTLTAQLAAVSEHFKTPGDRFLQVTGQAGRIGTAGTRLETIEYAWQKVKLKPLTGWGLDDSSGATFDRLTLTHNLLIRAWYQGGLAAFLAFALLFVASLVIVGRAVMRRQTPVVAAVLTVLWGFALTAATFQQGYFWLPLLGAWAFLDRHTDREQPGHPGDRWRSRQALPRPRSRSALPTCDVRHTSTVGPRPSGPSSESSRRSRVGSATLPVHLGAGMISNDHDGAMTNHERLSTNEHE